MPKIECCNNCMHIRQFWWWKNYPKEKQYGNCCVALNNNRQDGVVMQLYGDMDSPIQKCEMFMPFAEKYGTWIKDKSENFVTPGGDTVWCCSECGKGRHIYGIESLNNRLTFCPNCGSANTYKY